MRTNADFMSRRGDDFTGNSPQEPEGLYCVLDSDASTISVIAAACGAHVPYRAAVGRVIEKP